MDNIKKDRLDLLSRRLIDLAKEFNSTDNITVIAVLLKPPSELTLPSVVAMETPELAPPAFRTNGNGPLIAGDDDFGPETDVDAPDDSNPFGSESCCPRPDPVQAFSSAGVRFTNDFATNDNPFSNNLHDILEEKSFEEAPEKINGRVLDFSSVKDNGSVPFGFGDFSQTNGKAEQSLDETFTIETKESPKEVVPDDLFEIRRDLPDVVNIQDVEATPKAPETELFVAVSHSDNFEHSSDTDFLVTRKNEVSQSPDVFEFSDEKQDQDEKAVVNPCEDKLNPFDSHHDDEVNPFDRATPELVEEVAKSPVTTTSAFEAETMVEGRVELETLKSMMAAEESVNEDEPVRLDAGDFPDTTYAPRAVTPSADELVFQKQELEPVEFDGGLAVEDLVEAEGDGDESEEGWNYYKGGENQRPPSEQGDCENMNSPLNPDAAEFVPVSPPSGLTGRETPVKALPSGILDEIVASSPNWANMDGVVVPDEDTFLEGARNRPADVSFDPHAQPFEMPTLSAAEADFSAISSELSATQALPLVNEAPGLLQSVTDASFDPIIQVAEVVPDVSDVGVSPLSERAISPETERVISELGVAALGEPQSPETKPNFSQVKSKEEMQDISHLLEVKEEGGKEEKPRGLDLATDMTSSFIDPLTMGSEPADSPVVEGIIYNGFRYNDVQAEPAAVEGDFISWKSPEVGLLLASDEAEPGTSTVAEPATSTVAEPATAIVAEPATAIVAEPATAIVAEPAAPLAADLTPTHEINEVVGTLSSEVTAAAAVAAAAVTTAGVAVAATGAKKPAAKPATSTKAPTQKSVPAKKPATPTAASAKPSPRTPSTPKTTPVAPKPAVPKQAAAPAAKAKTAVTARAPVPKAAIPARPRVPTTRTNGAPSADVAAAAPSRPRVPSGDVAAAAPSRPRVPSARSNGIANGDIKTAAAAARPRVPIGARTNGIANGDSKAAADKKPAEPVKKIAPVPRVPLSSRPATASTARAPVAKTAAAARPASARPAAAPSAPKPRPATTAGVLKKTAAVTPKTNGMSKPAPVKRVVPTAKAETKTEDNASVAPAVVSNGVSGASE